MKEEFERAYRDELDHVRLTQEGKQALAERLGRRAAPSRRSPLGRAAAAAVAACLLAAAGGAAVVSNAPILRDRFFGGDSVGYEQSGGFVGKAVENNGWTLSITDCVGDDYYIYLGLELEAPEGTVLDAADYDFSNSSVRFTDSSLYGSWDIVPLPDDDPTDNKLPMMWLLYSSQPGVNGSTVQLKASNLGHNWEIAPGLERKYDLDCAGTWDFGYVTLRYPDYIRRLTPDTPVKAVISGPDGGQELDAAVSEIHISPLALYVWISSEDLRLHHGAEASGAAYYDCHEHQEVAAYDAEGQPIAMSCGLETAAWSSQSGKIAKSRSLGGGGCSGYNGDEGYIWLVFGFHGLTDVNQVATVSVNGVDIPVT